MQKDVRGERGICTCSRENPRFSRVKIGTQRNTEISNQGMCSRKNMSLKGKPTWVSFYQHSCQSYLVL